MTIKTFWYPAAREYEFNLIGRRWQFRIGTHQIALWRDLNPLFSLRRHLRWSAR